MRVRDVAKVIPATGPVEILRRDQVKKVVVSGDVSGVSLGQALQELKAALGKIDISGGYEISFGGQAQMMSDMKKELLAVLAFAIFFAFVILGIQFNSLNLPALIIGSVPACLAGVVFLLGVTGVPLGATVIIGVLLTVAATVNDGVLLLTFAEELRAGGKSSPAQAILNAGKIRLRPRVMTSLPIIAGMVPLALKLEEGSDMLQPMAVAAIGGMTLEIIVALYLMPCLYAIFTKEKTGNGPSVSQ